MCIRDSTESAFSTDPKSNCIVHTLASHTAFFLRQVFLFSPVAELICERESACWKKIDEKYGQREWMLNAEEESDLCAITSIRDQKRNEGEKKEKRRYSYSFLWSSDLGLLLSTRKAVEVKPPHGLSCRQRVKVMTKNWKKTRVQKKIENGKNGMKMKY